jgi:formylglycine-generating enzyme
VNTRCGLSVNLINAAGILSLAAFFTVSVIILNCGGDSRLDDSGFIDCGKITVPSDMKCIPGGQFVRGSNRTTVDEDSRMKVRDEYPESKITLSAFLMDTNEVTFSQYQECIKAKGCTFAKPSYKGYDRPNQPMLGISWYQAREFCKWRGKRLPTESEWEKSARGENGDLYPWGNVNIDCSRAIVQEKGKKGCGTGRTWDVGSRPSCRYGLNDIAGNSWEWVNDWYSESYEKCGKACMSRDPKGPCDGNDTCTGHKYKVVRGGSWWWDGEYALGHNRRPHFPSNKPYHHFGFRCAKNAE